jgi:hypothetical protein
MIRASSYQKDLVILTADNDIKATIQGILTRREIGIRIVTYDIFVHIYHDPGCFRDSQNFLRPLLNRYEYALVVFDKEGCGRDNKSREEVEHQVENKLFQNGWDNRSVVITIDPELELWAWGDVSFLGNALGWPGNKLPLNEWLYQKSLLRAHQIMPSRPKEAMEAVLKEIRKPRSSSLYQQLALSIEIGDCTEPAFSKFVYSVRNWFPEQ